MKDAAGNDLAPGDRVFVIAEDSLGEPTLVSATVTGSRWDGVMVTFRYADMPDSNDGWRWPHQVIRVSNQERDARV